MTVRLRASAAWRALGRRARRLLRRSSADLALLSSVFDRDFYRENYRDVRATGIDPLTHFVEFGWREGRNPNRWFDTALYLEMYPDVRGAGINPLLHFLKYGRAEGRRASKLNLEAPPLLYAGTLSGALDEPLAQHAKPGVDSPDPASAAQAFDRDFYLSVNPDVAQGGLDPFTHYMNRGWLEGRNPSRVFNTKFYLGAYPEAVVSGLNPLLHYVASGGLFDKRATQFGVTNGHRIEFDYLDPAQSLALPVSEFVNGAETTIGIQIHCFYLDVFETLLEWCGRIPCKKKYFVSVASESKKKIIESIFSKLQIKDAKIKIVPQKGRNLAALLLTFTEELMECEIALHLHTKKSVEKESVGAEWLQDIGRKLAFNRSYAGRIVSLMKNDLEIGAISPEPFWKIKPFMHWGHNKETAQSLLQALAIKSDITELRWPDFPAGAMFWFRPKALLPSFAGKLSFDDFKEEPIRDDGELPHAIERILTEVVRQQSYRTMTVAPLPYEACRPTTDRVDVSVVIPVKNGWPWIHHAIQSVVRQNSFHLNIELVVVDNGSADGTYDQLNRLAAVYGNLVVLQHLAPGAGSARNEGLRRARGDYILFLDADDILCSDAIGKLHALIVRADVDLVCSSLIMFNEIEEGRPIPFGAHGWFKVIDGKLTEENTELWDLLLSDFGPCAKMYRRRFLMERNIEFPKGRNFEDNLFIAKCYLEAERIGVMSATTYLYRRFVKATGQTQSTQLSLQALIDQCVIANDIMRWTANAPNAALRERYARALAVKIRDELNRYGDDPAALRVVRESEILGKLKRVQVAAKELPWSLL